MVDSHQKQLYKSWYGIRFHQLRIRFEESTPKQFAMGPHLPLQGGAPVRNRDWLVQISPITMVLVGDISSQWDYNPFITWGGTTLYLVC